jgi:predicted transcriptional regulator
MVPPIISSIFSHSLIFVNIHNDKLVKKGRKMTLKEYINAVAAYGVSIPHFSHMSGISAVSIYKYLDGAIPRLRYAQKIVQATNGKVTLKDLGLD